jgi:hypothetical protein
MVSFVDLSLPLIPLHMVILHLNEILNLYTIMLNLMVMCCDGCIKVDMSFVLTFCAGVSAAMNELRPCAPLSLKNVLAEEVVKGLQAVSDSLVRYNAMRMLRGNESSLFLSLCQAFIEVAYPYCSACFGRCYPNGAILITERRSTFDAVSQLLTVPARSNSSGISIERRQSGSIERKQSGAIERKQSEGIERKQSIDESAGTTATDNGTPANGPPPVANDDSGTSSAPAQPDGQTTAAAST